MIRTFSIMLTFAAGIPVLMAIAGTAGSPTTAAPMVIGARQPVFLGRMAIVATPLPD